MSGIPPYAGTLERAWYYGFRFICGLIFLFLIIPILVIIPLSFNAEPYFTFTPGMLALDSEAYSMRWYEDIVNNPQWLHSMKNSFIIGILATMVSTTIGTIAALGLSRSYMPYRNVVMMLLISPMIVPIIISATAMFFFFAKLNLTGTYFGIILSHAVLGTPFVIITVTATMSSFDQSLIRAAASLGCDPRRTFFKITLPLILPGVISGGLFAFITSFDEVVMVLFLAGFEQRTIPRQMWSGLREQISPTILAVATLLIAMSICLLTVLELLRRRSEKLRGLSPG